MSDPSKADSNLKNLAPLFQKAVEAAIKECGETKEPHGAGRLEVKVFEALRSEERQAWLYAQGRTRPGNKVTNAKSARTSWHGYGLAVDVVHRTKFWSPYGTDNAKNEAWFKAVASVFKKHGCNWGGDWNKPDTPHMQWGKCTASPTDKIIAMHDPANLRPVWELLQASKTE